MNFEYQLMARTVWGEARGESFAGRVAVAWVIHNRVRIGGWWGSTIGEVVLKRGQFSCWNEGDPNRRRMMQVDRDDRAYVGCVNAVVTTSFLDRADDPTNGATHYHSRFVRPYWAERMTETARIGNHVFYRGR
jgi:spore germination cell wall hydrolase CwlJ-like protein|tara:strand:+ start:1097 stop:1495 length:399 start_codon:yes stop_codon:yes gene_type:complete